MMKLEDMTKNELSLLIYLETRAVDYGGLVPSSKMSPDDMAIAKYWNESGFLRFGRLARECVQTVGSTYWCELSDNAWSIAHEGRRNRWRRINGERKWYSTKEKRAA